MSTLFEEAQAVLVGGVNSPVRAFKSVGGNPIFMKRGQGPYLYSEDNKKYIDYVLSWGAMLLGHAHPAVTQHICEAAKNGTSFGTPSSLETTLALHIQEFFPSMEKIRFVNSGTEAVMSAIRLARGYTGRDILIKFNGCYHGHADSLLVAAGSGALTFGQPDSAGVPADFAKHTLVLDYNDTDAIKAAFSAQGNRIAAVILEPVCGNMGVVLPQQEFLNTIRTLCTQNEAVLIFDEVMTGFRVHQNGAQALFDITPDLTCLGKVIGGGLPCAAFGGKREIMDKLAPLGPVYQAGTLSGNPLAMAAGIAALTEIKHTNMFEIAKKNTDYLIKGIQTLLTRLSLPYTIQHCGTMFTLFFTQGPLHSLSDIKKSDLSRFNTVYHRLLEKGIYMAPSQFEANFMSGTHTSQDIEQTLTAIEWALTL